MIQWFIAETECAEDFERMYVYLSQRLLMANTKKDKEIMEEIVMHLRSIRDNWKEVIKSAKAS